MNPEIKRLGSEGIRLARDLFIFYQLDDGVAEPITPSDNYLHRLLAKDSFYVLVALVNGIVVGGLTAYELEMYKEETTEVFLYEIGVAPLYRQQGIAKRLVEHLKNLCVGKGIQEMYVGAEIDNDPAKKLYASTNGQMRTIAWFEYKMEKE